MRRVALLFGAASLPRQRFLRGVAPDLALLKWWLRSNAGGAWEDDEIFILDRPTRDQIRKHIEFAGGADYAFVSFSGHGFSVDSLLDNAHVCLLDGDVPLQAICPASARSTVLVDACRTLELPDVLKKARDTLGGIEEDLADRAEYRNLFDAAVGICERGKIVMTSCSSDEAAAETPSGGLFTRSLVLNADAWANNARGKGLNVLSSSLAFDAAASATTLYEPQQHPEYSPGRRQRHFPLAVNPR